MRKRVFKTMARIIALHAPKTGKALEEKWGDKTPQNPEDARKDIEEVKQVTGEGVFIAAKNIAVPPEYRTYGSAIELVVRWGIVVTTIEGDPCVLSVNLTGDVDFVATITDYGAPNISEQAVIDILTEEFGDALVVEKASESPLKGVLMYPGDATSCYLKPGAPVD